MDQEILLRVLERLALVLVLAPAAFPFLGRFGRQVRTAAIALYAVAMGTAIVLTLLYFIG